MACSWISFRTSRPRPNCSASCSSTTPLACIGRRLEMPIDRPYKDVPGTTIFDAEQSRMGYPLNQFCMSLMKAENRERFKKDERAYLDEWAMTGMSEEEYRNMMIAGGRDPKWGRK